ncbi:hypothetical protein BDZ94DRAFT_1269656 [Collybia nuda]|uniref:Uncharacterized protein n=1 Tax=Collybia nuda TaxID=64659 RepID=A0A9P5XXF9_9AGAR|nr:hypothetical protein BDZ94DRAFT_1269656 [Collybia nuda]
MFRLILLSVLPSQNIPCLLDVTGQFSYARMYLSKGWNMGEAISCVCQPSFCHKTRDWSSYLLMPIRRTPSLN